MLKMRMSLIIAALLSTQMTFAMDVPDSNDCAAIAKICTDAGFSQAVKAHKKFWMDCMKPAILGKTVEGVSINPATAKACRLDKINQLQAELKELQDAT